MRVLVTSGPGAGHLGPLLPIVAALLARGDDVDIAVPAAAAAAAATTGARVVTIPPPPAAALADAWERFRAAPPVTASAIANGEIFGRLHTRAALPTVAALVSGAPPELVLHEAADYAGAIAARRAGVLHAQVAISLAEAEWGSLRHAAVELERIEPGFQEALRASPYLSRFPAAFDASPYPETHRYRIGAANNGRATAPGLPLVYVTLGTAASAVDSDGALLRSVLAALRPLDLRVVVTTGRGHRPDLGPLDGRVRVEEWVDQDVVLAEAAVVVCHGGSGTVLGALTHGVPVVAMPLFADQPVNAGRIVAAGAGMVVARSGAAAAKDAMAALTADETDALREAVARALGDDALRAGAARIAAGLRAEPHVLTVVDRLAGR